MSKDLQQPAPPRMAKRLSTLKKAKNPKGLPARLGSPQNKPSGLLGALQKKAEDFVHKDFTRKKPQKLACGGVAKLRLTEMTKGGKPSQSKPVKGKKGKN